MIILLWLHGKGNIQYEEINVDALRITANRHYIFVKFCYSFHDLITTMPSNILFRASIGEILIISCPVCIGIAHRVSDKDI